MKREAPKNARKYNIFIENILFLRNFRRFAPLSSKSDIIWREAPQKRKMKREAPKNARKNIIFYV